MSNLSATIATFVAHLRGRASGKKATARILVVVSEPNYRRLIRVHLDRAGYAVREAKNGGEAWRNLQAETFDLLITDVRIPELDGFQLLKLMDSLDRTAIMPVIIFTDKPNTEPPGTLCPPFVRHLHGKGRLEGVQKPFNPTELTLTVQRILGEAA